MKRLLLIRHAKSSWKNPDLDDFNRPLNKRGRKDGPKMGKLLAKRGEIPDLIISSPAKRALKTAFAIAKDVGYPEKKIKEKKKIYLGSVSQLMNVIHNIGNEFNRVFLFGHNPGFNDLSHYLTKHELENIPTCGVFCIDFEIDSWKEVAEGNGKFVYFEYPPKS
jgi:phosphohistidine phosphatase